MNASEKKATQHQISYQFIVLDLPKIGKMYSASFLRKAYVSLKMKNGQKNDTASD